MIWAFVATKSKEIPTFNSESRWFKGLRFLYENEDNETLHYTEEKMRPCFVCRERQKVQIIDVKRFSNWNRLARAMAYAFRFINNTRSADKHTGLLLQEEIVNAENYLFGIDLSDHYLDEIIILNRNDKVKPENQRNLDKSSELYKCSSYLDDHGVSEAELMQLHV